MFVVLKFLVELFVSKVALRAARFTERRRKTKIGTEVAHVTRDSDTTFKVKATLLTAVLAHQAAVGGRGNVLAMRICCYVAVCSAARGTSVPTGEERGGPYRGGRPPAACYIRAKVTDTLAEFCTG